MGEVMTRGIINMPLEMVMGSINGIENYHSTAQSLLADYDALRAENERLRKVTHVMIPTDTMEQEFAKYHRRGFDAGVQHEQAKTTELKRDADRWRFYREWYSNPAEAEANVDAAMEAATQPSDKP